MTGLILPEGVEQSGELLPVSGFSCEPVRVAVNILADVIGEPDPMTGEGGPSGDLSTYEGQLTIVHNELASACGQLCTRTCALWTELSANKIGIEVPVAEPERSRRDTVIRAISLGIDDENFELSRSGRVAKEIIERRIALTVSEFDQPDLMPEVTDEAYEQVATLAEGSHAVEIQVIGMLIKAAMNESQDPLVTPDDPGRITAGDVRLLFTHPKMQYVLRAQKTPRSQIPSIQSR